MQKLNTAFIYSKEFLKFKLPKGYPWSLKRTEATYQLCKKQNLLNHEWISIHKPTPCREKDILTFHDKRYIDLLKQANNGVLTLRFRSIARIVRRIPDPECTPDTIGRGAARWPSGLSVDLALIPKIDIFVLVLVYEI